MASELQLRGHVLSERDDFGNMQVVTWQREHNRVSAASDPRGIGSAKVIE
jgi:gamma-glutamyltranspeptidase/glutathione hydrolase